MKSVNRVSLLGNVGKEPEVKYLPNGTAVAKFSLATNDSYKDKSSNWVDRTEWHNLVCFSKLAEIAGQYVHKGNKIYVEGKIQTRSWDKDGVKHFMTEINATDIVLLSGRDTPPEEAVDTKPAPSDEEVPS